MHNFTMEDLIQFLYKETSPDKTAAITSALKLDWSLREKMNIISGAHSQLNTVEMLSPRRQTLENIFNYAEKSIEAVPENA